MSLIVKLPTPTLHAPVLSTGFAVGACTLFTLSYVGSLYLSPAGRLAGSKDAEGNRMHRDHPSVIRARMKTASLATAITVVATGWIVWVKEVVPPSGCLFDTLNISRLLGIPLPTPSLLTSRILPFDPPLPTYLARITGHILSPLLLTSLLFLGPLHTLFLRGQLPFQSGFTLSRFLAPLRTLAGVRNFLVGPLTEELVFRSSLLTILSLSPLSSKKMLVFGSPAFFGMAHIHHAYNVYLQGSRTKKAALNGALIAGVQFAYTMVFGWYANFLFLRSASVSVPTVAHVLCNVLGLPNPGADSEDYPKKRRCKWIWTTHAVGIVLFAKLLFPLTSAKVMGASLYWPEL
ncbi:related to CAAX prenyl protease 2 [Ustilago sp. UG-2017b]|nr:related to CAAX prenyl protease 2 [Ustilago sp. UG-2017b]